MQLHRLGAVALLMALGSSVPSDVIAQGLGGGGGLDDLRMVGKAAALTPCATNFVFDWSDSTGCNAITAVIR